MTISATRCRCALHTWNTRRMASALSRCGTWAPVRLAAFDPVDCLLRVLREQIVGSTDGRIFLGGTDGCVYELIYHEERGMLQYVVVCVGGRPRQSLTHSRRHLISYPPPTRKVNLTSSRVGYARGVVAPPWFSEPNSPARCACRRCVVCAQLHRPRDRGFVARRDGVAYHSDGGRPPPRLGVHTQREWHHRGLRPRCPGR